MYIPFIPMAASYKDLSLLVIVNMWECIGCLLDRNILSGNNPSFARSLS